MEIFLALGCVALVLWLVWRWKHTSTFEKLGIPGPKPNLLFGNILELYRKGPIKCHQEWVSKYGKVLGYYYGMKPVLLVTDPMLLKNIFIKDFSKFMNREAFNPLFKYNPQKQKGQSVLNLPGQAWKDVRSILTPTFTTAKMKQMSESMNSSVDDMVEVLEELNGSGGEVEIYNAYQRLTMDVITRTAYGVRTDVQRNPKSKVLAYSKSLFSMPYRSVTIFIGLSFPWLRRFCMRMQLFLLILMNAGASPHKMLTGGIKQVLEMRRQDPKARYSDLLQLMINSSISTEKGEIEMSKLEAGNVDNETSITKEESSSKKSRRMDDEEIIASAFTVLLAGYETTSTALGFTTYLLAKHQDIQEKLFQEIDELVQNGNKLEYASVNKLPYMDQVMNESMRIYPPVILFTNRYALEDVEYGSLKIPKDMLIQAPVYLIHHDPDSWCDPEVFDPERFSSKIDTSNGITYMPFGVGPRNCLGMRFAQLEAKLALANVIHKFRLHLTDRHKGIIETKVSTRMMTPNNGVFVRLEKRNL